MKKIILIIVLFIIGISMSYPQTYPKLIKTITASDSVFTSNERKKVFNIIDSLISTQSDNKLEVTTEALLLLYWDGYIDGSLSALKKKEIDLDDLRLGMIANKKSIKSYIRFKEKYVPKK